MCKAAMSAEVKAAGTAERAGYPALPPLTGPEEPDMKLLPPVLEETQDLGQKTDRNLSF